TLRPSWRDSRGGWVSFRDLALWRLRLKLGLPVELGRMGRTPGSGLGGRLLEWWSSGRVEMFQLGSTADSCKKVSNGVSVHEALIFFIAYHTATPHHAVRGPCDEAIKRPLDGGLSVFHGREAWISEERISVAERVERVAGELPAKVKESLPNLFAAKVAHSWVHGEHGLDTNVSSPSSIKASIMAALRTPYRPPPSFPPSKRTVFKDALM
ncbi:hypothetical protein BHE74_00044497, partial [Ensete ventricosum]